MGIRDLIVFHSTTHWESGIQTVLYLFGPEHHRPLDEVARWWCEKSAALRAELDVITVKLHVDDRSPKQLSESFWRATTCLATPPFNAGWRRSPCSCGCLPPWKGLWVKDIDGRTR